MHQEDHDATRSPTGRSCRRPPPTQRFSRVVRGPIRFGVVRSVADDDVDDRLSTFTDCLARALGRPVQPFIASTYDEAVTAFEERVVDAAWLPPLPALRGIVKGVLTPVAVPVRAGGRGFHAVLFSRRGTPFDSATRLMGARAAWVDPGSAAGYLVIRAALASRGVGAGTTFNAETFLGTHDAVVRAVLDGQADVGATFLRDGAGGRGTQAGWTPIRGAAARVRVLLRAGPIPDDVVAVSTRLPATFAEAFQRPLIDEEVAPEAHAAACALFAAERFAPPVHRHLDPLARMLEGW